MRIFTLTEAARELRLSKRSVTELADDMRCYASNGNRRLFQKHHIQAMYNVIREGGHPAIEAYEDAYIEKKAAEVRRKRYIDPQGFIYFIEAGGFIKIGFTRDWTKRLHHIKTASPFPVVVRGIVEATADQEGKFHRRFARYHHHLEWFRLEGELAEFVATLEPPK